MNILKYHERYNAQKEREAEKKRWEEEQEKRAKMTPEELEAYLAERDRKVKNVLELLTLPYTVIDKKY